MYIAAAARNHHVTAHNNAEETKIFFDCGFSYIVVSFCESVMLCAILQQNSLPRMCKVTQSNS